MSEFISELADFSSGLPKLRVPDIEDTLSPMGREYIVGDSAIHAHTEVLQGRMDVCTVQDGMVLYRTTAVDLCSMRTSNLLHPGLKIVLLLAGESELRYGDVALHLRAAQPGPCAAVVALTQTQRFVRQWKHGRSERKLVLSLSPEWLARSGVWQGDMHSLVAHYGGWVHWQPSVRVRAVAEQLHAGRDMAQPLHQLWLLSRCLEVALEALGCITAAPQAPVLHTAKAVVAEPSMRVQLRMVVVRDWLMTPAADGLSLSAIAKHVGMSCSHLQRYFPWVSGGMSVGQFVRHQRLLRARNALEQGQASVAQAAQLAGYRSSTHFAQAFRKCFGVVPSALKV